MQQLESNLTCSDTSPPPRTLELLHSTLPRHPSAGSNTQKPLERTQSRRQALHCRHRRTLSITLANTRRPVVPRLSRPITILAPPQLRLLSHQRRIQRNLAKRRRLPAHHPKALVPPTTILHPPAQLQITKHRSPYSTPINAPTPHSTAVLLRRQHRLVHPHA